MAPADVRPPSDIDAQCMLRVTLAGTYRVFAMPGWTKLIYNHITVRVPGTHSHILINPFGLHYTEVTASNLVKVYVDGNVLDDSPHRVNRGGLCHARRDSSRDARRALRDARSVVPRPERRTPPCETHRRADL